MKPLLLAFLLAAAGAVVPAADNTPLAGKWNIHFSISGYEGDLACTFTQNDNDVAGTCKSEQVSVSVTGKLDGKNVALQYKTDYNGEELTVVYTGKLESPSRIVGSVTVQPMGIDGDFTATPSK